MSKKKKKSSVRSNLLKTPILQELVEPDRERGGIHPNVLAISGIVPAEIAAKAEYLDHLLKKHR